MGASHLSSRELPSFAGADIYAMSNADEYWAEGTQSWFDATVREDVNDGHNTREKLAAHDPALTALLAEAYGSEGTWRFEHDSPAPFTRRTTGSADAPSSSMVTGMHRGRDVGDVASEPVPASADLLAWLGTSAGACLPAGTLPHVQLQLGSLVTGPAASLFASCMPTRGGVAGLLGWPTRGTAMGAAKQL